MNEKKILKLFNCKERYELQLKLSGYNHLINADDVINVCDWLLNTEYDIIKHK